MTYLAFLDSKNAFSNFLDTILVETTVFHPASKFVIFGFVRVGRLSIVFELTSNSGIVCLCQNQCFCRFYKTSACRNNASTSFGAMRKCLLTLFRPRNSFFRAPKRYKTKSLKFHVVSKP